MKQAWKELDKRVYIMTFSIIMLLVALLGLCPDIMKIGIEGAYSLVVGRFGWMYVAANAGCFLLFFYLCFSKYGNIKLGKPQDKPRFSTFSWAAMIFTSGAGSSTVILGFAEPLYYLTDTPFHIQPMSEEAYEYAHMYGQFHWGLSAWAFYVPAIVAISYMLYMRDSRDVKLSNTMSPLFGKKFRDGWAAKILDTVVAVGIVASITTSLGLGVPVMSRLISDLTGIPDGKGIQLFVFTVWFLIFGWSVFRGLENGIQKLTNVNMKIIFAFLLIFLVVVPAGEILGMELNSIGLYLQNLPRMVFYTDPFGDKTFVSGWTMFYWAWWLIFIPIMGIFIAKVSRGRTLRQVLVGQMLWGTLGCCTFLAVLGGDSLYLQKNGIVDLVSIVATEGNEGAVLAIMHTLPWSKFFILVLVILCFVFLATTIDSTALVLGTATSERLDPDKDPHLYIRFSWALAIFALSIALSFVGGLKLVQSFAIVLGFPLIFIAVLITISVLKAIRQDYGDKSREQIIEETQYGQEEQKCEEPDCTAEF